MKALTYYLSETERKCLAIYFLNSNLFRKLLQFDADLVGQIILSREEAPHGNSKMDEAVVADSYSDLVEKGLEFAEIEYAILQSESSNLNIKYDDWVVILSSNYLGFDENLFLRVLVYLGFDPTVAAVVLGNPEKLVFVKELSVVDSIHSDFNAFYASEDLFWFDR